MIGNLQINSLTDISILVALFGVVIYFFGKLISDTKAQKEEKTATYVDGFFFVVINLIFPIVLIYAIYKKDILINWVAVIVILLQFLLTTYLSTKWKGLEITKLQLKDYAEKKIDKVTEQVLKSKLIQKIPVSQKNIESGKKLRQKLFYQGVKPNQALFLCTIALLLSFIVFIQDVALLYKFFSGLTAMLTLSFIAMLATFKMPQDVEVFFDKGSIKGRLNKIEEGYITIFQDNLVLNINKDKVKMLKRELYNKDKLEQK